MKNLTFERDFKKSPLHYFTLLCVQVLGLWGIFWFSYAKQAQFAVIVGMALSYVFWGLLHHRAHRDLHIGIVLEYILIAALAILIFGSLLLSS